MARGRLKRDGVDLPYEVRGTGDPVLLVHGAFGQAEIWEPASSLLAEERRVVAYDRRGYGRSTSQATSDFGQHIGDAATILEEVIEEPATVVGWSTGGNIGLGLAVERPDLVRSLVVIEPAFHGLRHFPGFAMVRTMLKISFLKARSRPPAEIAETFGRFELDYRSGSDRNAWDELSDQFRRIWCDNGAGWLGNEGAGLGWAMERVPKSAVAECGVPITYVLGEKSHAFIHRLNVKLARAVPDMTTVTVPDATHALHVQQPDALVDVVVNATIRRLP